MDTSAQASDNVIEDKRSLNHFPDDILKHILSFLETRIALQTSLLVCKRWRYMWTSLPNLDFRYHTWISDRFMGFVDRVLLLHGVASIQKISLSFAMRNEGDNFSHVKTWISDAVMRNAQEFVLDLCLCWFGQMDANVFPDCLFTSKSIRLLKISLNDYEGHLPSQIFLPGLKILTLSQTTFKDHHPTNLLFASPSLEELTIENCNWKTHSYDLNISGPKLRSLTIDESEEDFWMVELSSNSVTISAPKLKIYNYTGGFIKTYRFPCASSIYKAILHFTNKIPRAEIPVGNLDEVLSLLQAVKFLQLSTSFVKAMSSVTVPVFKNLITLEIYHGAVNLSCNGVGVILNNCPSLETIIMGIAENHDFDHLYLPSTLKNITVKNFKGNIMELSAVHFLLANAAFLDTMKISCKIHVSAKKHLENILSIFPRASKSCKLDFHFP